jgi:hypothetical protein
MKFLIAPDIKELLNRRLNVKIIVVTLPTFDIWVTFANTPHSTHEDAIKSVEAYWWATEEVGGSSGVIYNLARYESLFPTPHLAGRLNGLRGCVYGGVISCYQGTRWTLIQIDFLKGWLSKLEMRLLFLLCWTLGSMV